MIPEDSDPVALAAQADIHRFYIKVLQPALQEFTPTDYVVGLEACDMEDFLEAARRNTHNSLCYEMRRTFALIIGALFERQLRSWLSGKMPNATKQIEKDKWPQLIKRVQTTIGAIGTDMTDLEILWSVANAVRHGNGTATRGLLEKAPQFWEHTRMQPELMSRSDLVGNMHISDAQLVQFVSAVLTFWHRAGASPVPIA